LASLKSGFKKDFSAGQHTRPFTHYGSRRERIPEKSAKTSILLRFKHHKAKEP
jgi:hypothetical protein